MLKDRPLEVQAAVRYLISYKPQVWSNVLLDTYTDREILAIWNSSKADAVRKVIQQEKDRVVIPQSVQDETNWDDVSEEFPFL